MNQITDTIRSFLRQNLEYEVADDEDIFESGYVNSLFAVELVTFIESEFSLTVPNEDLTIDNFRSVDSMASCVDRLARL